MDTTSIQGAGASRGLPGPLAGPPAPAERLTPPAERLTPPAGAGALRPRGPRGGLGGLRGSALLVAIACAAGCARTPPSLFPSAEVALDRMRATSACSRAVQGEATLDYFGEGGRVRGKMLYLGAAPARLRFDVYSPFGVTLSTLTSDGERFSLLDLRTKEYFHGPATTCNVERFTRVPVPPFALVELLRGQAPVLVHAPDQAHVEWRSSFFGGGRYVLEVRGAHSARQEIELKPRPEDFDKPYAEQRLRVESVRVWQEDYELYRAELAGHRTARRRPVEPTPEEVDLGIPPLPPSGPICDAELPRRVRISVPESGQDLVIRNEQIWHNPGLAEGVFRQTPPAGVTVRESVCAD